MAPSMTPEHFIKKWTGVTLSERSAAHQYFLDICAVLGEPTPVEVDPSGNAFTFEKGGTTATGGHGWADVWKKGAFAWEFKGPGKDLNAAYLQLKKYADMLENPPLLITSDMSRIEIHTNFTNTVKTLHVINLSDLADPAKRELVRAAFSDPEKLRPGLTRQQVTTDAASTFSELAHHLQARGHEPQKVAHFLNRIIFCMFAEDVGLLPNRIFSKLAAASVAHPEVFESNARQLFAGMSKGGAVAFEVIEWFNGGLFEDDATLPLEKKEIELVLKCAELDWTNIEPSIFGTLFERGLDPDKRSQQGAHYTDPGTIMKIVRPVVVEPWERMWEVEKSAIAKLADRAKKSVSEAAQQRLNAFLERLANFRVLDPACGSGNFLYLSLRALKDFEKRVILEAEAMGLPIQFPRIGPESMLGIEVNPYAAELARVTIWIGEIQWMLENGFGPSKNPILKPLDRIECRDAILDEGASVAGWPSADAIVGNPPFLGAQSMRRSLGDVYVGDLRQAYDGLVSAGADLCTYWLYKAREAITQNPKVVAGLVATSTVRHGKNREQLDSIAKHLTIISAWSDQPWINEGASVRVSIICFAKASHSPILLDGIEVRNIRADLTTSDAAGSFDATSVRPLRENQGLCFQGPVLVGEFDVAGEQARDWLRLPANVNGRPNADVLRPLINGRDIVGSPRDRWVIDFASRDQKEAALFEAPFEHVVEHVKPARAANTDRTRRERWWLHGRTGDEFRAAVRNLTHYIATPRVAKHRIFVRLPVVAFPDTRLTVVASDSLVTLGILHSRLHEVWALATCSWHGVGNDPTYNTESCFETFPFPLGIKPGKAADTGSLEGKRIAEAASELLKMRDNWLFPPELVTVTPEVVATYPAQRVPKDAEANSLLRLRTLTELYNARPQWLKNAHLTLDEAVSDAYGWNWPLSEEDMLRGLFELNKSRASLI